MPPRPDLRSTLSVTVDLASTLAPLRVGVADPCWRSEPSGAWWWATRSPVGDVTIRFAPEGDALAVSAWGDGAEWAVGQSAGVVGAADAGVDDASDLVRALQARFPHFRVAASGRVADAAIEGVCRRGVSAFEAARSWGLMVEAMGDDAPGPGGLRLPPSPRRLASCDPYELHVLGLEQGRADEVRRIASHASRLEVAGDGGAEGAIAHLGGIAGVGTDVVDHARSVALGDADAPPVTDAHTTTAVVRALWTGDGDDIDLPRLMAPHRPHRGRLVRLVALAAAADAATDVGLRH